MRWALFGPMPGSLPSSSIRSWTGPSNMAVKSEPWYAQVAHAAGQRPEPVLGQQVTCAAASAIAPTMRSCSVSTSSGSTTFGSIDTPTTSPLPFIVTCTRPPPAWPCTSALASCSWASISFCCTCCACARSADMSGWPPGCMTVPLRDSGLDLVSLARMRRFGLSSLVAHGATLTPCTCQRPCVSARPRLPA